jgi:Leucine-rich repeat (LRR) protein
MNKDITPSEDYLKAVSGKFDLDIVFYLDLRNKSISKLGAIPNCTSILLLNLSKNKLSQITGISSLIQLNFLDLSFNSISSIDCLETLVQLRHLELHGNNITEINPSKLGKLVRLDKLTFQIMPLKENKDLNTSNPLCKENNYRNNILSILPKLRYLDGIHREMEVFELPEEDNTAEIEKALNIDNFNFDFANKVKLNADEIISQKDVNNTKKTIEEKYNEFEKGIAELKASLNKIK